VNLSLYDGLRNLFGDNRGYIEKGCENRMLDLRFAQEEDIDQVNTSEEETSGQEQTETNLMTPEEIANHPLGKVLFDVNKLTPEFIEVNNINENWLISQAKEILLSQWYYNINDAINGDVFVTLPQIVVGSPFKQEIDVVALLDGLIQYKHKPRALGMDALAFFYAAVAMYRERYSNEITRYLHDLIVSNIDTFTSYLFGFMLKNNGQFARLVEKAKWIPHEFYVKLFHFQRIYFID